MIHLLDINGFTTNSERDCTITTPDANVTITAPEVLTFSRFVIRNYYVITIMFPPGMRFQFTPHDKTLFPPFDAGISPTQIFQFSYNANCSYYEASYEHEVTRFVHSQLLTGNGIIDLTLLPLNLMEVTLNEPIELRPLFAAMMFDPFVYGIVCHGVVRPDIARTMAPLIIGNPNMHIVDLHDCGIESGLAELSDTMQYGKTSHVSFWDLSDNPILDMSAFCVGLSRTCAHVFYLNLNRTHISGDATKILFKAICMNKHLWGLRYLCISGAAMRSDSVELFAEFLHRAEQWGKLRLQVLDVSDVGNWYEEIFTVLIAAPPPLRRLVLGKSNLNETAFASLMELLGGTRTLVDLGLADTSLDSTQLATVIETITSSEGISQMSIDLSGLRLNGKKLGLFLQVLEGNIHEKWTKLRLDRNGMQVEDLLAATGVFRKMPCLKGLSMGGNFKKKNEVLPPALVGLVWLPALTSLELRGGDLPLGQYLHPLLEAVADNPRLVYLDVSGNKIGARGYKKVCELLERNRTLVELNIDGSYDQAMNEASFWALLEAICESSVIFCGFPRQDVTDYLMAEPPQSRPKLFHIFAEKQRFFHLRQETKQVAAGHHSDLSSRDVPELKEILNGVTRAVHHRLKLVRTLRQHRSFAAGVFGLPFPFLADDAQDEAREWNAGDVDTVEETIYGVEHAKRIVVEEHEVEDGMLRWRALLQAAEGVSETRGESDRQERTPPGEAGVHLVSGSSRESQKIHPGTWSDAL
jgi:hypothetical protein